MATVTGFRTRVASLRWRRQCICGNPHPEQKAVASHGQCRTSIIWNSRNPLVAVSGRIFFVARISPNVSPRTGNNGSLLLSARTQPVTEPRPRGSATTNAALLLTPPIFCVPCSRACEHLFDESPGVHMSVNAARKSACATRRLHHLWRAPGPWSLR